MTPSNWKARVAIAGLASFLSLETARAGITDLAVFKDVEFTQSGPSTLDPLLARFTFDSVGSDKSADSAVLTFPGPTSPFNMIFLAPGVFTDQVQKTTLAEINTQFPFGVYSVVQKSSTTHSNFTASLDYTYDLMPNATPSITAPSYNALQNAVPGDPITVFLHNAFTPDPNDTSSWVSFSVTDPKTHSSYGGIVPLSTTSVTIPGSFFIKHHPDTFNYSFLNEQQYVDSNGVNIRVQSVIGTGGSFLVGGPGPSGAPEPAMWCTMLLGLAAMGGTLRSKRTRRGHV
jgi:hypothetical protein